MEEGRIRSTNTVQAAAAFFWPRCFLLISVKRNWSMYINLSPRSSSPEQGQLRKWTLKPRTGNSQPDIQRWHLIAYLIINIPLGGGVGSRFDLYTGRLTPNFQDDQRTRELFLSMYALKYPLWLKEDRCGNEQ